MVLTDDHSLTWLASTTFVVAPYFDTQPAIQHCLRYHQDINTLFACTTQSQWQQASTLKELTVGCDLCTNRYLILRQGKIAGQEGVYMR